MARKSTFWADFSDGFKMGRSLYQDYASARDLSELEDEEVTNEFDPKEYAKKLGLQAGGSQAEMLAAQDVDFGSSAADQTARGLNYAGKYADETTPVDMGYSYLGRRFDERPSELQQELMRANKEADIYSRYGMRDDARQAKQDARGLRQAMRADERWQQQFDFQQSQADQSQSNWKATHELAKKRFDQQRELHALQLEEAQSKAKNRKELEALNRDYAAAMRGDPDALVRLMRVGAPAYNNPDLVTDDGHEMVFDGGVPMIIQEGGNAPVPAMDYFKQKSPMERHEAIQLAHMYAISSVTGDYKTLNDYLTQKRELDAKIPYYQAQTAEAKAKAAKYKKETAQISGLSLSAVNDVMTRLNDQLKTTDAAILNASPEQQKKLYAQRAKISRELDAYRELYKAKFTPEPELQEGDVKQLNDGSFMKLIGGKSIPVALREGGNPGNEADYVPIATKQETRVPTPEEAEQKRGLASQMFDAALQATGRSMDGVLQYHPDYIKR